MKPLFHKPWQRLPGPLMLFHALGGLLFIGILLGLTLHSPQNTAGVQAFVTPNTVTVRTPATLRFSFVLKTMGMANGGGLKIRLPKGFDRPQSDSPDLPNYTVVRTSNPRAPMRIAGIDRRDAQAPWLFDHNAWVLTALLDEFSLQQGDTIHVIFGADNGGRATPPSSNYSDTVLVAYDLKGDGNYRVLRPCPILTVLSRTPYRLAAFLPSTMTPGQRANLRLVVLDEYSNLALPFTGVVEISSTDALANLPAQVEFTPEDSSRKIVEVSFHTPGVHEVHLRVRDRQPESSWEVLTNPVAVVASDSLPYRVFWGDLHSHSSFSYDGYGNEAFAKARDVACLDFYASTEHVSYFAQRNAGLTPPEWESVKRDVIRFHAPGEFVTFPAYEFSAKAPSGHHNIYFNTTDEIVPQLPLFRNEDYAQIQNVWQIKNGFLPPGVDMITVPHHTGIIWNELVEESAPTVSFGLGFSHPRLRPLIEIYSGHGSSESYDPAHPLSYASLPDGGARGLVDGPHYAQDAWASGERLGAIASSDDHSARPGLPYWGLAAVYAKELTRDAIFDALKQRRTYATTGQRIFLHFDIEGNLMGSQLVRPLPHYPQINVTVHGTGDLEFVEILSWDRRQGQNRDGHPVFYTLHREIGAGKSASFQFIGRTYAGATID